MKFLTIPVQTILLYAVALTIGAGSFYVIHVEDTRSKEVRQQIEKEYISNKKLLLELAPMEALYQEERKRQARF